MAKLVQCPLNNWAVISSVSDFSDSYTRVIHEPSAGLSYSLFKNPQDGTLLVQAQYAHFLRHPWYVAPGRSGMANNNTVYLNVRYVLPGSPPPGPTWKR